jgi:hypothetical protein
LPATVVVAAGKYIILIENFSLQKKQGVDMFHAIANSLAQRGIFLEG